MKLFDYVIVGGGSAGCVLANRLSADARNRVCLVEAGPDLPPDLVPDSIYSEVHLPDYFQANRYWTDLQAYKDPIGNRALEDFLRLHQPQRYEQARVMGGGSSINGQVAARGLPCDYDEWESLGAAGWNFESVLPYLRRLENDLDFDGPLHGRNGPFIVRRTFPQYWGSFSLSVRDALAARGIGYYEDAHAHFGDGCFPHVKNNYLNHRAPAVVGYLDNRTRGRKNLEILAETIVDCIHFSGRRATGVTLRRGSQSERIAAHEVILSAGVMHSPALLMRAGIGPADHLRELGIPVLSERPGVGQNLQDHPMCGFGIHIKPEGRLSRLMRNNYPMTVRWTSGFPDCGPQDMKLTVSNRFGWSEMGLRLGTLVFGPYKSYSKGFLKLASADPRREPMILLNVLSDSRDFERMKYAARFAMDLLRAPAVSEKIHSSFAGVFGPMMRSLSSQTEFNKRLTNLAGHLLDMGGPARKFVMRMASRRRYDLHKLACDDAALESWIREGVEADWHAVGTCRMGNIGDKSAVVDPLGCVIGVEGLRVADASIMPVIPRANTNVSTLMIGEKLSDAILTHAKGDSAI
ncbi:MAG: GMC family oxidoreductase [Parvibaculaceae bacterium]